MEPKKIWYSKTFWVNVIAGVAMIAQAVTGKEILSMDVQASILSGVNILLRFITKGAVTL